jgi:homoserine kinase
MKKKVKAFAPATVANVAVGFDILGFALEGLGEMAIVEKINGITDVIIEKVEGYPNLPLDPLKNTATAGLVRLINERKLDFGFRVQLKKTIPVGSGLGGSSTSAVATMVAANAFLKKKLSQKEIFDYALTGEAVASGSRHGDNVGPCIAGGLTYVRNHPIPDFIKIKTPKKLRCVIILPDLSIRTKDARGILKSQVPLKAMIEQTSNLAGFILGCTQNNFNLIGDSLKDVIIEPQRASLIPGFYELQKAALEAGALGFSISGSGPAMFALTENPAIGKKVEKQLVKKAKELKLNLKGHWLLKIATKGARIV